MKSKGQGLHRYWRYWPSWVAVVCWVLVLVPSQPRSLLLRLWTPLEPLDMSFVLATSSSNASSLATEAEVPVPLWLQGAARSYPHDRRVQIELALAQAPRHAVKQLDALLQRSPEDPFLLALWLRTATKYLQTGRYSGPLSNPNWPKAPGKNAYKPSPAAEWRRFVEVASQGRHVDPQNTYFDWMLLMGLFALHRDGETTSVLADGARKQNYNSYLAASTENRLAVRHMAGALTPADIFVSYESTSHETIQLRQIARFTMENVMAARDRGEHDKAIDNAFHLLQMARVLRLKGYSFIDSLVGRSVETIALSKVLMPQPVPQTGSKPWSWSISMAQTTQLPGYAAARGRKEVSRQSLAEWNELARWSRLKWPFDKPYGLPAGYSLRVVLQQVLAGVVLRTIPAVAGLWLLLSLFRWRFKQSTRYENVMPRSAAWRSAAIGLSLLLMLFVWDVLATWISQSIGIATSASVGRDEAFVELLSSLLQPTANLLSLSPLTAYGTVAGVLLFAGLASTVQWQRSHLPQRTAWWKRVREVRSPADIVHFDFSFLMALTGRFTLWIVAIVGPMCLLMSIASALANSMNYGAQEMDPPVWPVDAVLFGGYLCFVLLQLGLWLRLPRRREALKFWLHMTRRIAAGYLVLASVLVLPLTYGVFVQTAELESRFRVAVRKGELAELRERLKI